MLVWSLPAYAVCSSDKTNNHTVGSVSHGWSRVFCQPANNYNFTAWTNHGHGTKFVEIAYNDTSHVHCSSIVSGSKNASCSKSGINSSHMSGHDIATPTCTDRFNDRHGIDCHFMEALP